MDRGVDGRARLAAEQAAKLALNLGPERRVQIVPQEHCLGRAHAREAAGMRIAPVGQPECLNRLLDVTQPELRGDEEIPAFGLDGGQGQAAQELVLGALGELVVGGRARNVAAGESQENGADVAMRLGVVDPAESGLTWPPWER